MFISKTEKKEIADALVHVDKVQDELIEIIKGLNERVGVLEQIIGEYLKTEHKRVKQREYARSYYAKKRANKQAENTVTGVPV